MYDPRLLEHQKRRGRLGDVFEGKARTIDLVGMPEVPYPKNAKAESRGNAFAGAGRDCWSLISSSSMGQMSKRPAMNDSEGVKRYFCAALGNNMVETVE